MWFDSFEYFLVQFGYGFSMEYGSIFISNKQKARILNIDTTALSMDRTRQKRRTSICNILQWIVPNFWISCFKDFLIDYNDNWEQCSWGGDTSTLSIFNNSQVFRSRETAVPNCSFHERYEEKVWAQCSEKFPFYTWIE